jgi:hypothetical protein
MTTIVEQICCVYCQPKQAVKPCTGRFALGLTVAAMNVTKTIRLQSLPRHIVPQQFEKLNGASEWLRTDGNLGVCQQSVF